MNFTEEQKEFIRQTFHELFMEFNDLLDGYITDNLYTQVWEALDNTEAKLLGE